MSGKYQKKKNKKKSSGLWSVLVLLLIVLGLFAALWIAAASEDDKMPLPSEPLETTVPEGTTVLETTENPTELPFTFEEEEEGFTGFALDRGVEILRYGKYVGIYMEDGSDEFVTNVMMIEVRNSGEEAIQYAKLTLSGEAGDAVFTLTTLMPGDTMVVLEAQRKAYNQEDVYTEARLDNIAVFAETPSLLEEQLQIQPLDGGFNITNISGEDITGEIAVYFKDMAGDMYYGGITYVCRIAGGLKAGEVKQIMSSNFTDTNSRVVFIKISQ